MPILLWSKNGDKTLASELLRAPDEQLVPVQQLQLQIHHVQNTAKAITRSLFFHVFVSTSHQSSVLFLAEGSPRAFFHIPCLHHSCSSHMRSCRNQLFKVHIEMIICAAVRNRSPSQNYCVFQHVITNMVL